MRRQPTRHHHRGGEDQRGKRQMGRQPVLADRDPVDQAGRHHPPADGALQPAEREQGGEARAISLWDCPAPPEPQQGEREDHADGAADQPVQILPEKDVLELAERHAPVDLPIFGRGFVTVELGLPLCRVERRYGAGDRLPPCHRQARFRKAGDAADHHHHEDHRRDDQQPAGDRAGTRGGNGKTG